MIDYLESLNTAELTLRILPVKLATLLALTIGQKCQTLWAIDNKDIEICSKFMKVRITQLLKQSKPNNHLQEMYFEHFQKNPHVCVIQCMKIYLAITRELRTGSNTDKLFLITGQPR